MPISESVSSEIQAANVARSNVSHSRIYLFCCTSRDRFRAFIREIDRAACITAGLFVLFVLPTSLLLAVLVPLGEVADEPAQLVRADSLLHGEILAHWQVSKGGKVRRTGVDANPALVSAMSPFPGPPRPLARKKLTPEAIQALEAVSWNRGHAFFHIGSMGIYMPIFYAPAAVAVGLARLFHFSPYYAALSARFANAIVFTLIGACALLFAKRGRMLLFCVLAIPMTISLAASANEDGLLIATSVLAFALLTRAVAPHGAAYWAAAILIAIIAIVKVPYVPLVLMLLIPCGWSGRFKAMLSTGLRAAALAAAPGLIWISVVAIFFVVNPFTSSSAHSRTNGNVGLQRPDMAEQVEALLHRPSDSIILPMRTIENGWPVLQDQMIGVFGWLELWLPRHVYDWWMLAIGCAAFSDILRGFAELRAPPLVAISIGTIAVFAAVCAIFDAEYLTWTPVGAQLINGVQGRYLLPILAALAACIPGLPFRGAAKLKPIFATPAFAMTAVGLVLLPSLMISTYYLQ